MKRFKVCFSKVLLLVIFILGVTPHHAKAEEKIKEPVIIGVDSTFAPYAYVEDGEFKGFDVELVDEIFTRLDLDYKFQSIDWQMKESELNSGNIDVIMSGYAVTPEREKIVTFSDQYLDGRVAILVRADSNIETKADLAGGKVATQEGSSQLEEVLKDKEFVDSLYEGRVITMSSFNEVLSDLENGRVDAIVISETITRYYFKMNGQAEKYRTLEEDFGKSAAAAGFRKEDTALAELFNKALAEIREDGTYEKISSNWFADFSTGDEKVEKNYLKPLLDASLTTLKVFFVVLILSVPLGLVISLIERISPKFIKMLIQVYVYVFRGTPLLLQLMIVFFGLPYLGIVIDRMPAALITMVINYAAYLVEIFRGGLNAIPKGQYEALKVLSIKKSKGLTKVILPQLWKIVMPSVGNEIISLVKDTSLIYVLGLEELLKVGRTLSNQYASMVPFLYVGLIYLVMTGVVTIVLRRIEKRLEV